MDSVDKLTSAITLVEEARGVPLSASCVVHRAEMLEILDDAREALPTDFESARKIIEARDAIIEEANRIAENYETVFDIINSQDYSSEAFDKMYTFETKNLYNLKCIIIMEQLIHLTEILLKHHLI